VEFGYSLSFGRNFLIQFDSVLFDIAFVLRQSEVGIVLSHLQRPRCDGTVSGGAAVVALVLGTLQLPEFFGSTQRRPSVATVLSTIVLLLGETKSTTQLILSLSQSDLFGIHDGSLVIGRIVKATDPQSIEEGDFRICHSGGDGAVHARVSLATQFGGLGGAAGVITGTAVAHRVDSRTGRYRLKKKILEARVVRKPDYLNANSA